MLEQSIELTRDDIINLILRRLNGTTFVLQNLFWVCNRSCVGYLA